MDPMALGGAILAVLCGVILIALVIHIFFLLTMMRALQRVSPPNRLMQPGMVWLNLIPCVNLVWQFFIATQVPDSLKNEFQARGLPEQGDFGRGIGLGYCILSIITTVLGFIPRGGLGGGQQAANAMEGVGAIVGCVSAIASLIMLVLGIMFWIKIANASGQLAAMPATYPGGDYRSDLGDYDRPFRPGEPPGPSEPPDTYRPDEPGRYQ
jgi:hypothetical protein